MKHFLRFLYLRARDLIASGGTPPYTITFNPASPAPRSYYRLSTALRLAMPVVNTEKGGATMTVCFGLQQHSFTRDRFNRVHLPLALRHRMF